MPFIRYSTLACGALATPTRLLTNTVTVVYAVAGDCVQRAKRG